MADVALGVAELAPPWSWLVVGPAHLHTAGTPQECGCMPPPVGVRVDQPEKD